LLPVVDWLGPTKGRFVSSINRDPDTWARLGRALRESRERQGLTQGELAKKAHVATKSVSDAEAGKVPKARKPYTLEGIAQALGWPVGAVDSVLSGGEPPGGWQDVRAGMEGDEVEAIFTNAMVRATNNATAAEIRNAVKIAMDDLRRRGYVAETVDAQPNGLNRNG
jgi:transcriptional regulator with XRE-family HTH domain